MRRAPGATSRRDRRVHAPTGGRPSHHPGAPAPGSQPATLSLRRELARKALHLSSAAAPLLYAAGAPRWWLAGGLGALLGVALAVEAARARSERARHHFTRYTGALLREHEHRRWSGATWMLGAYLLAAAAYPRPFAIAAMWAVGVGDASAAIVGRWWGERRRWRTPSPSAEGARAAKTYAGTAACFVAAFVGARWVAGLPPAAAALTALLAAAAERPRAPLDDNLRIVLAVGAAALVWRLAGAR